MHELDLRAVDLAFAAAWPAAEAVALDGWLLRATAGVTRRGNSALALGSADAGAVEEWYCARGLVPRIQIAPSSPAGVGASLEACGWVAADGACSVLASPIGEPVHGEAELVVSASPDPTDEWVVAWWTVSPRGGEPERRVAEAILGRIPSPRSFGLARDVGGAVVACTLGVVVGELLVIESSATLPAARRQGACRALTAELMAWGRAAGARHAVLSVERLNEVGSSVWERLGFTEIGRVDYLEYRSPGDVQTVELASDPWIPGAPAPVERLMRS